MEVVLMREDVEQNDPTIESEPTVLAISPEKVCFIILKAREFGAKDEVTEPDPGSNPADDGDVDILEDHADDPVVEELTSRSNRSPRMSRSTSWRSRGAGGMTTPLQTGWGYARGSWRPQ
jgi:hypothetical protein